MNYPSKDIPWTRIVEHKHFTNVKTDYTIITREYPAEWDKSKTPYYPINDDRNTEIYKKYREKADSLNNFIFGGRLANYQYYDMHQCVGSALSKAKNELL